MLNPVFDKDLTDHQRAYCETLARTGAEAASAHEIGWNIGIVRKEAKASKLFRESILEAKALAGDEVLRVLQERAYEGESLPAIAGGLPIFRRCAKTGEVELDDNFEPKVLTYKKHDKAYLFKLMDALVPEMREGGTHININALANDDEAADKSNLRIQFILPEGKTEDHYEQIERSNNTNGGKA